MWVAEIFNSEDTERLKLLRGPICHVGRKVDCDISFPNDKSISRQHANIIIEKNEIYLVDLGSKFHTYIGGDVCPKDEKKLIKVGDIIKFGAQENKIIVKKLNLEVCVTRLEKSDKDKLKALSKSIGIRVVKNFEDCSYVICNQFTATIKILNALVFHKPIVKMDWLLFFDSSKEVSSVDIPSPSS
eukprot:gene13822-29401_t